MLSAKAQAKIDWFVEADMKATFDNEDAFREAVESCREKQLSKTSYIMPEGLPQDVSYERRHGALGTECICVSPRAGEELSDLVIVYYHGGGFLFDLDFVHLNLCARLVKELNCRVVAPIYPCMPLAHCDETFSGALDAYNMALNQFPGSRFVLMGDSAGGHLCLTVSLMAKEQMLPQPRLMVPFSPFIDLMGTTEEIVGHVENDPLISWMGSRKIARMWGEPYDPLSFPPDPFYGPKDRLPSLFLLAGSREVLLAGIREYARQVEEAGGDVRLLVAEGLWHAFLLDQGCDIPEVEEALSQVLEAIRSC